MSDNKDSVKIQHLIDEAERLPKDEATKIQDENRLTRG